LAFRGRPDETDAKFLCEQMTAEIAAGRYTSLVDLRSLLGVEPDAFRGFVAFMNENREVFERRVTSSVLVCADAFVASLAAGYAPLVGLSVPRRTVADLGGVCGALGLDPTAVERGAAERWRQVDMEGGLLLALKSHLERDLGAMSLARYAQHLGVSARGLQRDLERRDTTFEHEVTKIRVARAKEVLRGPYPKLLAVAMECGYRRVQSLDAAFRRIEGISLSEWCVRERCRVEGFDGRDGVIESPGRAPKQR